MRYMKLSTFLLLLDGRLFVPTIQLLQDGDRLESRVPEKLLGPTTYGRKMQPIVELTSSYCSGRDAVRRCSGLKAPNIVEQPSRF